MNDTLSWSDIHHLLDRLHTRILSDNFHPDLTIAVGREGALVGSLFALNWRYKPFVTIDRDFSFDTKQKVHVHDMIQDRVIGGKNILLIDCEINTGTTMREMTAYLLRKNAQSVRTLALARSDNASFHPDYTGFIYRQRVTFPWEYTKEIKEIRHAKSLDERR